MLAIQTAGIYMPVDRLNLPKPPLNLTFVSNAAPEKSA
jgi:hypothetical protein